MIQYYTEVLYYSALPQYYAKIVYYSTILSTKTVLY